MLHLSESIWRWLARTAFFSAIVLISFLAFSSDPPDLTMSMSDKFNHALAFFVLALVLDQAYAHMNIVWGVAFPLIAYGFIIEVVQGQLGYREMSLLDVGADSIGIALYAISRGWVRQQLQRIVVLRQS